MKAKRKWLIPAVLVLLLGIGGVGGYLFYGQRGVQAKVQAPNVDVPLGELLTNLADAGQRRYVQADIVLVAAGNRASDQLSKSQNEVRDTVLGVLRNHTADDLKGKEGMDKLRKELTEAINAKLAAPLVRSVYFLRLVIQ